MSVNTKPTNPWKKPLSLSDEGFYDDGLKTFEQVKQSNVSKKVEEVKQSKLNTSAADFVPKDEYKTVVSKQTIKHERKTNKKTQMLLDAMKQPASASAPASASVPEIVKEQPKKLGYDDVPPRHVKAKKPSVSQQQKQQKLPKPQGQQKLPKPQGQQKPMNNVVPLQKQVNHFPALQPPVCYQQQEQQPIFCQQMHPQQMHPQQLYWQQMHPQQLYWQQMHPQQMYPQQMHPQQMYSQQMHQQQLCHQPQEVVSESQEVVHKPLSKEQIVNIVANTTRQVLEDQFKPLLNALSLNIQRCTDL